MERLAHLLTQQLSYNAVKYKHILVGNKRYVSVFICVIYCAGISRSLFTVKFCLHMRGFPQDMFWSNYLICIDYVGICMCCSCLCVSLRVFNYHHLLSLQCVLCNAVLENNPNKVCNWPVCVRVCKNPFRFLSHVRMTMALCLTVFRHSNETQTPHTGCLFHVFIFTGVLHPSLHPFSSFRPVLSVASGRTQLKTSSTVCAVNYPLQKDIMTGLCNSVIHRLTLMVWMNILI